MLDGSDSAEAVAAVRARIEARDAAKAAAEEAANAEAAEAAAAAAKAPPKKGKQSAEELAAEEAAAAAEAEAAAQAAAAKAAEAAAQAAADDAEIAKANVNWADPSRLEERALPLEWTPLMHAAARGESGNVELLIAMGADINVKDTQGMTPLHKAAGSATGGAAKVELLVLAKADIRAVDRQGMTPLHVAASNERVETIPKLMQLGASQFAKNGPLQDGDTPYQMAVSEGLHEVAKVLRACEVRRKGWSSGHSLLIPADTPSWEPEPFTPKRMSAKGTWDSIAFDRFVRAPGPKRFLRHSSNPIGKS